MIARARLLWLALAACVAALVALATPAAAQMLSPGPLAQGHASLEGDQHCNDCHSSGKRVEAAACLKCHNDLGARIAQGKGLHGQAYRGKACESCHVDHLGRGAKLVRWPGGDPSKLDHAQTGWPLGGAHKSAACAKCHNKANARGAPTFLGLSTACTSCHKDPHENRFGAACTNCHTDSSWKEVRVGSFNHDLARFALKGAHAKVECAKCHHEPPKWRGLEFERCTSCHKDPHGGKLGSECTSCHSEAKWKPAQLKPGGHPRLSLANGHAKVACKTCHDRGTMAAPSRGSACVSCHKPVHEAPFGRECATCHGSIQWLGLSRAIALNAHPRTAYPLTGKHGDVPCASCHKPQLPPDARFRQLKFGRCLDCHKDEHKGTLAAFEGGECKGCHTTSGYRPTLFSAARHASTKFPLAGKHAATACSACHTNARPRLDLRLAKQACEGCHDNPHGDQFAKEMAQGGCAHCHEPAGWHLPKIDHRSWPLTGAHATTRCESCHKATAEDRKSGHGASYRGAPRECKGCHLDVHAGQFTSKEPVRACDSCHATASFKLPSFDHGKSTRYVLDGAHAAVACAKCHAKTTLKDGSAAVRYRLPSTECRFCHASPHVRRGP